MRIWDIKPGKLCRNHLLGEHRELHAIWTILTRNRRGYSHHPETKRWRGKLNALYLRHEALSAEMGKRNYKHKSRLSKILAIGSSIQNVCLQSIKEQKKILRLKKCGCKI